MNQYMKNLSKKIAVALVVPAVAITMSLAAAPVGAQINKGITAAGGAENTASVNVEGTVLSVVNWLLFAVGVIAVIMLIWGGIRYVISGGAADKVKDAKNTILYAIVGLIVAILGYALVNWVISIVGSGSSGTGSV
jgi:hypothetical protein